MTDEHKAALERGRQEGRAVRDYLEALRASKPKRGRKRTPDSINARLDKIEAALVSLGGSLQHVVRTRVFVSDISDWEPVARAHGVRFAEIRPANTLVEARLVGDEYLVEIEAEAIVGAGDAL